MKAIVFERYGSPDYLKLEDAPKPVPGTDDVLIRVHAASINEWDWGILKRSPFASRITAGLIRPGKRMLGADLCGRIEAVGENVSRFAPDADVMVDLCRRGSGRVPEYVGGAFAEYVCVNQSAVTAKPVMLNFEQAASLPQSGALAVQGFSYLSKLRKQELHSGLSILINGASGGTGTLAVQIAKSMGMEVAGVCRTEKMDAVHSLGADHVIDYTQEDFTKSEKRYDLILDIMGFHSLRDCRRVLKPDGSYVILGGSDSAAMEAMICGRLFAAIGSKKKTGLLIYQPNEDLDHMAQLVDSGKVSPVIDKTYSLEQTTEAFRYYTAGHAIGKVIITASPP